MTAWCSFIFVNFKKFYTMEKQSEKPRKFERVYRPDLKNGSDYYIRSANRHPSCGTNNTKKK